MVGVSKVYKYLSSILAKFSFKIFIYNKGIYINPKDKYILIYYINNILVIYKDLSYIYNIVAKISYYIKIEEIGIVSTFLGNSITINYKTKILYID